MRRRSEGTIYKDKFGRWWAQLPADPKTGRRTKRRARDESHAVELLHELHSRRKAGDNGAQKPTFAQFAERYLEDVAAPKVEPTTLAAYRAMIERNLNKCPVAHDSGRLGDTRLDDITPEDCQKALNSFARGKVVGKYGAKRMRSHSQIRQCARLLKRILRKAAAWRLIPSNPADDLELPRGAAPRVPEPLELHEAHRLLDAARDHRNTAIYHVALTLGLRRGELLGLAWRDVDYIAGTITIRRQVNRLDGANALRDRTKTGAARTVPLPPGLADQLRAHFVEQAYERHIAGAAWQEHGLIFPTSLGAPMTPQALNVQLRLTLKRANLRHITVHTMRHSVATWLDEAGVSESTIAGILGHTRKTTITRRYIHSRLNQMRAALEAHEITLRRAA